MLRAATLLALALLSPPAGAQQSWRADDFMAVPAPRVRLPLSTGARVVETAPVGLALGVLRRIGEAAGVQATLYIVEGDEFRAFVGGGLPAGAIGLSLGALTVLGTNADRMAAVLAHELAHVKLAHIAGAQVRNGFIELLGALAGAAVEARTGVPLGGVLTGTAGRAAAAAFDRQQELDADALGIDWMRRAGYNPQGALDVLERLTGSGGWFASHPSGADRVEAARRRIAQPVSQAPYSSSP